jgi:hypothetical protein
MTELTASVEALRTKVDRLRAEGSVNFAGTTPVAVLPTSGRKLNMSAATRVIVAEWAFGRPISLPVSITPVKASPQGVQEVLQIARPAVSGPLLARAEGSSATLDAGAIADILTFEPGDGGALVPKIDRAKKVAALESRLTQTEKGGAETPLVFDGDRPTLKPSKPGRVIDWDAVSLLDVLKRTDHRETTLRYVDSRDRRRTAASAKEPRASRPATPASSGMPRPDRRSIGEPARALQPAPRITCGNSGG